MAARIQNQCTTVTLIFIVITVFISGCDSTRLEPHDEEYVTREFSEEPLRDLVRATILEDVQRVGALVEQGVDADGQGRFGLTPLMVAVEYDKPESVKTLLLHGANPNHISDIAESSPMSLAIRSKNHHVLQILLSHGGNPDMGKERRSALLVQAAMNGDTDAIKLLVEAGADVNGRGLNNDTAIIAAARKANYEPVIFLLRQGADHTMTNRSDESLILFLEERMYRNISGELDYREEVIEFLKAKGENFEPWRVKTLNQLPAGTD